MIEASPSSGSKEEVDSSNGSSFFFLLLIIAAAMGGFGVWNLGGVEKTKLHLRGLVQNLADRVQGGTGGRYAQVSGGLPR